MRILLFNQYGPGDASPTAGLLADLADGWKGRGWTVEWAADHATYGSRKSGWRRWPVEAMAHLRLLRKGLLSPRPDLVLSLTSPVCLVITASVVAWMRGARHIHWAMDLYPDLALALGEIRPGFLARFLKKRVRRAYGSCQKVVALDEDMRDYLLEHYGISSSIIRPWPSVAGKQDISAQALREGGWTWLYSGNLGRAHEWETLVEVQALLEKEEIPARLVFQGDGAEMAHVRNKAHDLGLQRCFSRPYAARELFLPSLLESSVLIVTRKPAVRGLLWPSKLALLEGLPRPLLWVGDTDGHVAARLKSRQRTGVFLPGQSREIKEWLLEVTEAADPAAITGSGPEDLRKKGLEQWVELLAETNEGVGLASGKSAVE